MAGGQDAIYRMREAIRSGFKFANGGAVDRNGSASPIQYAPAGLTPWGLRAAAAAQQTLSRSQTNNIYGPDARQVALEAQALWRHDERLDTANF